MPTRRKFFAALGGLIVIPVAALTAKSLLLQQQQRFLHRVQTKDSFYCFLEGKKLVGYSLPKDGSDWIEWGLNWGDYEMSPNQVQKMLKYWQTDPIFWGYKRDKI